MWVNAPECWLLCCPELGPKCSIPCQLLRLASNRPLLGTVNTTPHASMQILAPSKSISSCFPTLTWMDQFRRSCFKLLLLYAHMSWLGSKPFVSQWRHSKWAAWRMLTPYNSINPVAVAHWLFCDPHCVFWLAFSLVCFSFQPSTKPLIQLEQLLSSNWKRCQSDLENTVQIPWNKANHMNGLLAFKLQNPWNAER